MFLTQIYLHLPCRKIPFLPTLSRGRCDRSLFFFWQSNTEIFYNHHHIYQPNQCFVLRWNSSILPRFAFFWSHQNRSHEKWSLFQGDPRILHSPTPEVVLTLCIWQGGTACVGRSIGPSFGLIGIPLVEMSHLRTWGFVISYNRPN